MSSTPPADTAATSPDGAAVMQSAPRAMKHSMPMALSITFGILGAGFVIWLVYNLTWLIMLLYLAFVIATILEAAVEHLVGVKLHRTVATVVVIIGGLALAATFAYLLSGLIAAQVTLISANLAHWPAAVHAFLNHLSEYAPGLAQQLQGLDLGQLAAEVLPAWQSLARNALTGVSLFSSGIVLFFLVVYMLLEGPDHLQALRGLLPAQNRQEATVVFQQMASAHRRWFLATFANMLATSILTAIGLWILGVPGFLVLGIIAGFGELVPNIGPMAAAIPSLLVTLATRPDAFWQVVVMFLIVQTIQGYGISPLVMRRGVKLSVLALLVSVLVMGTLFGILGVFVAVPLTADLIVLWRYFNARLEKDAASDAAVAWPVGTVK